MKNKMIAFFSGFLFLLFTATASFAQTNEAYKKQIESLNKEMAQAMVAGDSDKSLSFYTKDVISLPEYQPMLMGIEALKKSNEEMKKAGWSVTAFNSKTLNVLSGGNYINETGTFEITFSMKGQDKPMTDKGKYVTIWEKQADGSLKIKIETWNTDNYPSGN